VCSLSWSREIRTPGPNQTLRPTDFRERYGGTYNVKIEKQTVPSGSHSVRRDSARRGPFVADLVWKTFVDPERQWVDNDGVEHVRRQASTGTVTGDVDFAASNVFNSDWDPAAKSGTVFGSYIFSSDDETWEGDFAGRMSAEESVGTWDGRSHQGRRLAGTFVQIGEGAYRCEWYVLGIES